MFAVSASRTMKNARPKHVEDDVVVRDIVQIREEKRRQAAEEAERSRRESDEALAAIISKYRTVEWLNRKTPKLVVERIARENGVNVGEIIGQRRAKYLVAIRDKAIRAVADEFPDMSLPAIGRTFSRDHTTILHSLRKTKPEGSPR
jgi:chromosomal replication initiation ATPase DnaA